MEELAITETDIGFAVNGAAIGPADLLADNGVIHIIDQVLLPPGFVLPDDIVDTAIGAGFDTLVAAIGAAGLVDALRSDIFTIFAPTDEAFDALPAGALDFLLANPTTLEEVLFYHAAEGETLSSALEDGMMIPTLLEGESLTVAITDGVVTMNGATVVTPDVGTLNGVIHIIDAVLLPPGLELPADIVETAVANGFDTLVAAVAAADLVDVLKSDIFTVFAPTDAAFAALPEGALDFLLANPMLLGEVLLFHTVAGKTLSSALEDGMVISPMLDGESLTVAIADGVVTINGATVVTPDVEALNGVVHVIDAVMLPPGFELVADPTAAPVDDTDGALTAGNVMALFGSLALAAAINAF
jgi:uncharacterized surface protein with fasciclin (FAS1) repeats